MENRILKFRYKYTDGKSWILKTFQLNEIINGYPFDYVSDNPLLKHYKMLDYVDQFTGLTDKGKKEMFESDIVTNGETNFIIEWNTQQACFWLSPINSIQNEDFIIRHMENQTLGNGYYSRKDLEVIGSIHENPELLNS